jgi:hypothetical protein
MPGMLVFLLAGCHDVRPCAPLHEEWALPCLVQVGKALARLLKHPRGKMSPSQPTRLPSFLGLLMTVALLATVVLPPPCDARSLAQAAQDGLAGISYSSKPAAPAAELGPVAKHTWRVTLGLRAPDCYERPVMLVNGQFQLALEVAQGDMLEVATCRLRPP